MLRIGETIDRYRIEALIGQGGMAAVYRATHVQLGSEHAIKVLFVATPQVRERMFREGQVQARLRHPNIVQVTDVLLVQNAPALVMEFVDGPALDTWLQEHQPTLEESLWLFRGILRGVAAAHEGGVVHRDLKPANVLLAPTHDGVVPKVADFGLVKPVAESPLKGSSRTQTQSGMALGTPEYMSPEQVKDASDTDQRTDMWALGCLLYELVCHRRAFSGADKLTTFSLVVAGTYEPPRSLVPDLPDEVDQAIRSLLEVDRDRRLATCQQLVELLYGEAREEPRIAGRLSVGSRPTGPLLASSPHAEITIPPEDPTLGVISVDVPTGVPAARRNYQPPPRVGRRKGELETAPPAPSRDVGRRSTWMALAVLALAGALVVGGLLAGSSLLSELEEPTAGPSLPPPSEEPAAAGPASASAPAPAVEEEPATFAVRGEGVEVLLVSERGRFPSGGGVPPGRYTILASFGGGEPVPAGALDLRAGDRVELACDAERRSCGVP